MHSILKWLFLTVLITLYLEDFMKQTLNYKNPALLVDWNYESYLVIVSLRNLHLVFHTLGVSTFMNCLQLYYKTSKLKDNI